MGTVLHAASRFSAALVSLALLLWMGGQGCGGQSAVAPGGAGDAAARDTGVGSSGSSSGGVASGSSTASEGDAESDGGDSGVVAESDGGDSGIVVEPDGGRCVTITASMYDTSCHADTDCVVITAGTFCDGYPEVLCGGATINRDDANAYQATIASIHLVGPGGGCPAFGAPQCVLGSTGPGVCTWCPSPQFVSTGTPVPAGCPDGGVY